MTLFPGRFPDEFDDIDIGRVERAIEARRILTIEEKRDLYFRQKLERDAISDDEWRAIAEHDELEQVD